MPRTGYNVIRAFFVTFFNIFYIFLYILLFYIFIIVGNTGKVFSENIIYTDVNSGYRSFFLSLNSQI